ncbi:partial Multidrug resistance protein MdtC, partial [Anaerolineae bacterium]
MTSTSSFGSSRVTLQFDLSRDIDGAARDVQAAINAAGGLLPTGMPSRPSYRKMNPGDAPIMVMSLTSDTLSRAQLYDVASTVLAQKISQVEGIGQVNIGGSSLPAVRVELNPLALSKYGISFAEVRSALANTNVNRPKGTLESDEKHWQIAVNDAATTAKDYTPLVIAYRNNAPVHLTDVGTVIDASEDVRSAGFFNGKKAVVLVLYKQSGAN